MECDDLFALAAGHGPEDLAGGFRGGHLDPRGNGIVGAGMKRSLIVHAANIADHEAGADEGEFDSSAAELGGYGIGESADGEFAHGVRRATGSSDPAGNASDDGQISAGFLKLRQGGVGGAKHAEDVGFELAAIVFEGKLFESTDDAEAGVGENHVELAVLADGFRDGKFESTVARDIAGDDERCWVALRGDFPGEEVQLFFAARGQSELCAGLSELQREFFADAGRGSGDEDGFVAVKGM